MLRGGPATEAARWGSVSATQALDGGCGPSTPAGRRQRLVDGERREEEGEEEEDTYKWA